MSSSKSQLHVLCSPHRLHSMTSVSKSHATVRLAASLPEAMLSPAYPARLDGGNCLSVGHVNWRVWRLLRPWVVCLHDHSLSKKPMHASANTVRNTRKKIRPTTSMTAC